MILDILASPPSSLTYKALQVLRAHSPGWFILETSDSDFQWQSFARAGECECVPREDWPHQSVCVASNDNTRIYRTVSNGLFDVQWEGKELRLLQIQYESSCGPAHRYWILAQEESTARNFFLAVTRWSTPIREEVCVYQEGSWIKDAELFQSIQSSRLENLILPPGLKEAIRDDAACFFASRDRYQQFHIAWKRGLILIGPPGNGKTHMIQALINDLQKPCLYLKSLRARYQNEDRSIREVFDRARVAAPCILVMEDLDSLIDDENRSFFLNELDGFRKNEGLLVIATTNHPDKLDPAIVDRPSRFDRKYHFRLPALPERKAYLRWWNSQLDAAVRMSEAGIDSVAGATQGFSFAYLKELGLASMMAWINQTDRALEEIMSQQVALLRAQMSSASVLSSQAVSTHSLNGSLLGSGFEAD